MDEKGTPGLLEVWVSFLVGLLICWFGICLAFGFGVGWNLWKALEKTF